MNYSLRQLKVFVTVARAKSFSRAGEMIGLSQSAVSHSVKELEHQTGVRLLDRTTREVVLTEAGQQLAGRLERLLDELNSTLRDAGRVGQQLTGTVRVAASQTISAHLIPQCIAHSNQRYPQIDFVLHDRPQQWVLESIRQGEVDFGIVIDPGAATDLQCETVLAEPFLLLCREDHPFASLTEVPWLALQDVVLGSLGLSGEGWFDGYLLLAALRKKAQSQGVRYVVDEAVGFDTASSDGVLHVNAVHLQSGAVLPCRYAVNAGGPWAAAIAGWAGIDLPVVGKRRTVFNLAKIGRASCRERVSSPV